MHFKSVSVINCEHFVCNNDLMTMHVSSKNRQQSRNNNNITSNKNMLENKRGNSRQKLHMTIGVCSFDLLSTMSIVLIHTVLKKALSPKTR